MRIQRPWLRIVLPALGSLVAFFGTVLWKVGENVDDVRTPAILGAVAGLAFAGLLCLRRSP